MVAIWLALTVYLGAVGGGVAYAALRGLKLWREVKRVGGVFSGETSRISGVAAEAQGQLDRAGASAARLAQNIRRLTRSRARLGVQTQALAEARETIRRMLWFVPGA